MTKYDRDRFGVGPKDRTTSSSSALERPSSGRIRVGGRVAPPDVEIANDQKSDLDGIIEILGRYLSSVNARILLERALQERNLSMDEFTRRDLASIAAPLRRGIELFVRHDRRKELVEEIAQYLGQSALEPSACTIPIVAESDIATARDAARKICEEMGAKSFAMHKVVTIVSELARNIVSYTKGGRLEITPVENQGKRLVLRAVDNGPGIHQLQAILSGTYQSKTGLGKGIVGSKRLADHFDITTGAGGTSVVVEIRL